MKTIVYYYTLTGQCGKLAGKIANQLSCESEKIIEKKKRLSRGFLKFFNGASAMQKKTADIITLNNDPGQFDRIVIVTPFWAASPIPAIRGFIDKYSETLKGKKLGLLMSNLGTDPAEVFAKYQELFPEPLITMSFTKANGEWQDPKENERINQFVTEFNS